VCCSEVEKTVPEGSTPVYWARPGTTLKTVILAMHKSGTAPVALFDDNDRFVGSIGVRNVLQAILRRGG
jgi:glycine betaine/proline transport system ATP-binding protein